MGIIAHRGFWKAPEEKNTQQALFRALDAGFGIETDIRDRSGELVLSHDVPDESALPAEKLFSYYAENGCGGQLALNVKADGIQRLLMPLLERYGISSYFLFDMSVPEMVVDRELSLKYYSRQSDVEHECVLYDKADGVWMDSFYCDTWLTAEEIGKHLMNGKRVCLVSPELHGRPYRPFWDMIKQNGLGMSDQIELCTDRPDEAREYFYGE